MQARMLMDLEIVTISGLRGLVRKYIRLAGLRHVMEVIPPVVCRGVRWVLVGMEEQIQLLREIVAGKVPPTSANILKAFNEPIIAERAVHDQRSGVIATTEALDGEISLLRQQISERKQQIERLKNQSDTNTIEPVHSTKKLLSLTADVANQCLEPLGIAPPGQAQKVLIQLVTAALNEQTVAMPRKLEVLKYLMEERLVRVAPLDSNMLKARIL